MLVTLGNACVFRWAMSENSHRDAVMTLRMLPTWNVTLAA